MKDLGFFCFNTSLGGVDTFLKNLLGNYNKKSKIILFINKSNPSNNYIKKNFKNIKLLEYNIFNIEEKISSRNSFIIFLLKIVLSFFFPILSFYQIYKIKQIFLHTKINKLMVINGGFPGSSLCLSASIAWKFLYPNKKSWHNVHAFPVKPNNIIRNIFYRIYFYNLFYKSIYGFISVSKSCSKSLKEFSQGNKLKYHTVYNGIKLNKFKKINLKKKLMIKNNSKLLVMLATYNLYKGYKFIFKVMEHLIEKKNNVYLVVFGDKYNNQFNIVKKLRNYSKARQNIFLRGYNKNKNGIINASDFVVIPSQIDESFGYVALEAIINGKVPISTNVGGIPEIIRNNYNGYVVNRHKPKVFANKILSLIKDKKKCERLIKNSKNLYKEKFSVVEMINSYKKILLKQL